MSKIIYFDNNATTMVCAPAARTFNDWLSCYNPSSSSKVAKPVKALMDRAQDGILAHCSVSAATHTVVFTSGATESNCLILKSCVRAYKRKLLERDSVLKPHIVASAVEHHSIQECLRDLKDSDEIDVTFVEPTIYGNINPEDVERAILPNTCLVTIMFANNEIPVVNNIAAIGAIAHKKRIPLHSDCVQVFGKYRIDVEKNNIDALSASAHKFYGPKGVGLLIVSNDLIEGYGLTAEIHGSQQHGLRGGTENIPGIASCFVALKYAFQKRQEKNAKLFRLRELLLSKLADKYCMGQYVDYIDGVEPKHELEIVSLGPPEDQIKYILPNTLLLSISKTRGKPFCNVALKDYLDSKNCIVSIGSACLTKSDKASHVLTAIAAPAVIKRGIIRISFGDSNTQEEVARFFVALVAGIEKQCHDLNRLYRVNYGKDGDPDAKDLDGKDLDGKPMDAKSLDAKKPRRSRSVKSSKTTSKSTVKPVSKPRKPKA